MAWKVLFESQFAEAKKKGALSQSIVEFIDSKSRLKKATVFLEKNYFSLTPAEINAIWQKTGNQIYMRFKLSLGGSRPSQTITKLNQILIDAANQSSIGRNLQLTCELADLIELLSVPSLRAEAWFLFSQGLKELSILSLSHLSGPLENH